VKRKTLEPFFFEKKNCPLSVLVALGHLDKLICREAGPAALPLGELAAVRPSERVLPLSVLAALGHLSQGERQAYLPGSRPRGSPSGRAGGRQAV